MNKFVRQTAIPINLRLIHNQSSHRFMIANPLENRQSTGRHVAESTYHHQQAITNPQFISKCPTFHRQVLSCVVSPQLIGAPTISYDASIRASIFLNQIQSVGTYSTPLGTPSVRKNIAKYISDSINIAQVPLDDIILMPGATHALRLIMKCLIVSQNDSIMIPSPCSHEYKSIIELAGGSITPYHLNYEQNWELELNKLEISYLEAIKKGKQVKALVLVNPGNPTGAVFTNQSLQQMVKFAHKHKLLIISDETNSDYIYDSTKPFLPIMKVLKQMGSQYLTDCEIMSLYSIQQTPLGAIGVKAAYIHCYNINPEALDQLYKLWNMCYSSNVCGQIALDLSRNPFLHDVDQRTKQQYYIQKDELLTYMTARKEMLEQYVKMMKDLKMTQISAGNYGYVKLALPNSQNQRQIPLTNYGKQTHIHHFRINIINDSANQLNLKIQQIKQSHNFVDLLD